MSWLELALCGGAAALLAPAAVVACECGAGLLLGAGCRLARAERRPRLAVLVPAHDEAAGIASAVAGLLPELEPGDRLLVVADNCSDRTAALAREAGAEVSERRDASARGKGYALRHGVDHLSRTGAPEVVVVIDADCRVAPGSVDLLARHAAACWAPVQADNLVERPPGGCARLALSELAFLVRNRARAEGLRRAGMPVQLTGTGMALPFELVAGRELGGAHLTEDLRLGLELALAGHPARRCPHAQVRSLLPDSLEAAAGQRCRWELGHLSLLRWVPRLAAAGILRGRTGLVLLAADLAVPPLSLLVGGSLALSLVAAGCAAAGQASGWLAMAPLATLLLLALALLAAWLGHGRGRFSGRLLLAVPAYLLWKLRLYRSRFTRSGRGWVRTPRA